MSSTPVSKNFAEILEALSEEIGVQLTSDENGTVLFGLDDDMGALLSLGEDGSEDDGLLAATFVIGRMDDADSELMRALLEANYMWADSGDGSFAVDPQSGLIVLQRDFRLPMSVQAFLDGFSLLAGAARDWKKHVETVREGIVDGMDNVIIA